MKRSANAARNASKPPTSPFAGFRPDSRSAQAVAPLRERGYTQVYSLRGGINAWLEQNTA